jgi:hypothetical protein
MFASDFEFGPVDRVILSVSTRGYPEHIIASAGEIASSAVGIYRAHRPASPGGYEVIKQFG